VPSARTIKWVLAAVVVVVVALLVALALRPSPPAEAAVVAHPLAVTQPLANDTDAASRTLVDFLAALVSWRR
jgi:multisubunit Na+/H+ antiporter MnhB subunit